MHRKITRQSRWNLRRASDRAIPNQAPETGEGVETGWRAPLVGEGTVRLSSKGESDRITKGRWFKSAPRNHERHCRNAVAFASFTEGSVPPESPSDLPSETRTGKFPSGACDVGWPFQYV